MINRHWIHVQTFALVCLGSLLCGYVTYGAMIFNHGLAYFQFVMAGVFCGAFVVAMGFRGKKTLIAAVLLAYAAMIVQARSTTASLLFRDAVWIIGLLGAVRAGIAIERLYSRLPFGGFVLWAAVFGVIHFAMFALLSAVHGVPLDLGQALFEIRIGTLIGAGIGVGVEISGLIDRHLWNGAGVRSAGESAN